MADFYYWTKQLWQVWGVIVFLGLMLWALWPGRRDEMDHCARIPLDDEETGHARQG
jgi:cytochrome c oxidase cbb3-type subunit IV